MRFFKPSFEVRRNLPFESGIVSFASMLKVRYPSILLRVFCNGPIVDILKRKGGSTRFDSWDVES